MSKKHKTEQNNLDELKKSLLHLQADFDNFRKNTEKEKAEIRKKALAILLIDLVPVLDNFERSTKQIPKDIKDSDWVRGICLIHQQLQEILKKEGLEKIETHREQFDPYLHEALSYEKSSSHKAGEIIEEIESGYNFSGEVLKHAKVRVAK